jgi:hypothetical protein
MIENRPTCGALVGSWLLFALAIALMDRYGNGGILIAIFLGPLFARLRGNHDKATISKLRETGAWQRILLGYFAFLLIAVLLGMGRGVRFAKLPFLEFLIMMMLPALIVMIAADVALCSRRWRSKA